MNNHELQALRKLLMLDVSEAAELVGNVSTRAWQYWESGRNTVPLDVEKMIYHLVEKRRLLIQALEPSEEYVTENKTYSLPYYHSSELFFSDNPGKNKVDWRVYQSAATYLLNKYKKIVKLT